jgi:hypothetical protein
VKHGYIQEIPIGEITANAPAYPSAMPIALPDLLPADHAMNAAQGLYTA